MTLEDKIKATAKSVEGHLQAGAGALSGNEPMELEGKAKQVQAHLIDAAGTLKDKAQQAAASLGDAIENLKGHES